MNTMEPDFLQQLDEKDQFKIQYFVELLLRQSKYKTFKKELTNRRNEIADGAVLTHSEIWNELDV